MIGSVRQLEVLIWREANVGGRGRGIYLPQKTRGLLFFVFKL
jgi:hypothetical protein